MDDGEHDRGRPISICAIGASAGGVAALRALFRQLPSDLGLAYVVVVHLSPDRPSALGEILAACTDMPVRQVEDGPALRPDHVYVIPPDAELVIDDDRVTARPFTEPRGRRAPIDMVFRSIASGRHGGLAVVLSGAGSDGATGVGAVKEAGGVVFVQDPDEAEFSNMPRSAIAVGVADFVAPVAELALRIGEVARSTRTVGTLDPDGAADELRRIVSFLRARTGHDFSAYKRATVTRRIARRMQVRRVDGLGAYADLLRRDPEEAQELFADLLISVTMFFRDPAAFESLAGKAVGPILDEAGPEGVRAWVVGCATGEEAYSVAMVMLEEMARRRVQLPVQIFASDLDEGALATAREGRYPRSIEADVSDERLKRFFVDEGTHYRIRREVRDLVLFASHSVLKDPPFIRLDLVTCRNLLIYLERSLQGQLCRLFHYGLGPHRYLFLGSAETADAAPELFASVDREARLYRTEARASRSLPMLPQLTVDHPPATSWRRPPTPGERNDPPVELHAAALERMAPPSALVGAEHEVVHLSPSAGRFILHPSGPFTGKLPSVVRPELRLDLKVALDHVFDRGEPTLTLPLPVELDGTRRRVALHVAPVETPQGAAPRALVIFMDGGEVGPPDDTPGSAAAAAARPDATLRLHEELRVSQERLVVSRAEHEAAIQDLRAANEELQSINEEYRSASEELETSKEELQSMNEELQTVNGELKAKLESISTAHSDLQNLTGATEIGTLFLDPDLRIRMFTPPVADLFNVTETDIGRAITDFTHRLAHDGLGVQARQVLRALAPLEEEVQGHDGRWHMMRLRPYRTIEDRIDGVVVTFVDVTARRETEARLGESEARYRRLFDSIDQGLAVVEVLFDEAGRGVDYRYLEVNAAFDGQTGLTDPIGRTALELVPGLEPVWAQILGRIAATGEPERFEAAMAGLGRFYEVYAFSVDHPEGNAVGVLFNDIAERKRAEEERELLTHELSHRVKNTLAVVQALAMQTGRGAAGVEEFLDRFVGRIQALGRAHGVLLEAGWRPTDLGRLAREVLAPFVAERDEGVEIGGDAVRLGPKQGLGLALVLHELATNASKYGSLSVPEGGLALAWRRATDSDVRTLRLDWRESGGPPAAPPPRVGFGTRMIERACEYELGGAVELFYDPEGFRCEIRFPLP